jgi:hypothetical protein
MTSRQDVQKQKAWAERLGRYRASGLSVTRFCASEGVSPNTFYYWARRVPAGSTAASPSPRSDATRPAHGAAGTTPPAVVRFHLQGAVEISVPADCLEAIRCLGQCLQQAWGERSGGFREVVVARR